MKNKFNVGDRVLVSPQPDDIFSHEFQGKVTDFRQAGEGFLYVIEDQDSDFFEVFQFQLTLIQE